MYIHSPIGPLLSHFSPTSPGFSPTSTSSSTSTSSTEDPGLGIRTTAWAPGGRFIAVGGWDGKVRVLESDGWRCIAVMSWGTRTVEKNAVSTLFTCGPADCGGQGIVLIGRRQCGVSRLIGSETREVGVSYSVRQRQISSPTRGPPLVIR
jgi:hypothetical protein